jgi:HPt (histidine-containing phosphotransfer) domain-containing protein
MDVGQGAAEMAAQSSKRIETVDAPASWTPIDLTFLAGQTLNDPGLESEVLRLFDDMVHVYFGRLETSTTVDDLVMNLHTIRGAAAGVGAFRLAVRARAAEVALREGQPVDPEWIEDIGVAIEEVSAMIAERVHHAAA